MSKTELESFYKDLSPKVFRYAMLKTSNRETAEDVTSETFLRLIAAEDREQINNINAWSFGIARNVILETYRERQKQSDIEDEQMDYFDLPSKTELEDQVVEEELFELLKSEIQSLDEITREIIGLRVWEELSFAEIAEIVEMKESATKLRFYRGLEQLKQTCESGTKARSIAWPILLAGFLKLAGDANYIPDPSYLTNLLGILHTQMSDIPKPDPVPTETPAEPTPTADPKPEVAEATTPTPSMEPAANAAAGKADFQTMLRVGWGRVQTQAFMLKLLGYSVAAMLVVGGISLASIQMANTQITPRMPLTVRESEESTPVEPDGGIGTIPLTEFCNSDNLGVSVSHPDTWDCKVNDDTISFLNLTKDRYRITISDGGRGLYCNPSESSDCVTEDYDTDEDLKLAQYFVGDELREIFGGPVKEQKSTSGKLVHISIVLEGGADTVLELNPEIEHELGAILDSLEFVDVEQPEPEPEPEPDPYVGWETYENEEYSIRYPSEWVLAIEDPEAYIPGYPAGFPYTLLLVKGNTRVVLDVIADLIIGFGGEMTTSEDYDIAFDGTEQNLTITYFANVGAPEPVDFEDFPWDEPWWLFGMLEGTSTSDNTETGEAFPYMVTISHNNNENESSLTYVQQDLRTIVKILESFEDK